MVVISHTALPRNFNLTQCKEGYNYTCLSQKMCVPLTQKCDTLVQCHDGSDELDCRDLSLFRGGDVRYDLNLWGKGEAVRLLSSLYCWAVLDCTFDQILLYLWMTEVRPTINNSLHRGTTLHNPLLYNDFSITNVLQYIVKHITNSSPV